MPRQRLGRRQEFDRSFSTLQMDDDSIDIPKKKLYSYLEELFKKQSSAREKALRTLVEEFETNVRYEFAENNFVTLVYRCQNCLKRGSAKEIDLALQLIGLVVLTLGAGDNAHEVYEELLVSLPQLLIKSKLCHAVKVMECLSIVTLVGARDFVDTERSMEIIWQFMNQDSKHPSSAATAAISGWTLLLSDIDRWSISPKKWKGLIPYLLKQLEEDDEHVNVASIEALALIFENGSLEKFSDQAEEYASMKDMKDGIMEHVKRVCNGTKQEASKILEDDYRKTSTLTLGGTKLTFSTWSQLKQISYIRRYLGCGFTNHMMENEHLHNVFHFAPATKCSDVELYSPEFEEVVFRVFIPDVRRESCAKRIHKSPSSLLSKGRTKLMNKYRSIAEETKAGHIADELD
ncbi:Interferon- developmental regulator 1 [Datura stramonium]|uniref:Interferon- developmental regulator 1 n=1 Tax=Datura stramonium TaxID=4076 RepID=A0ABS8SFB0_DATST|nr:Interferon- developmental regulator 1 [Datura stramonium]